MNGITPGLFADEVHQSFILTGQDAGALLVHGFPGTPAEMRPLGEALHKHGWTARGLLLPGFGRGIGSLFEQSGESWVSAVQQEIRDLRTGRRRVILVGYSFGGMVSLNAIVREPVDALVLIAPFWKLGGPRERLIWGLVRPFARSFRPFKDLDFDSPEVAAGIGRLLPGLDLSDPQAQAALRDLRVPGGFIDGIGRLGQAAKAAAGKVTCPVLVVQGTADELTRPQDTAELCRAFPNPPQTLWPDAGHDLLAASSAVLPAITRAILSFEAAHQQA